MCEQDTDLEGRCKRIITQIQSGTRLSSARYTLRTNWAVKKLSSELSYWSCGAVAELLRRKFERANFDSTPASRLHCLLSIPLVQGPLSLAMEDVIMDLTDSDDESSMTKIVKKDLGHEDYINSSSNTLINH